METISNLEKIIFEVLRLYEIWKYINIYETSAQINVSLDKTLIIKNDILA